jgi:hypothetical protein
VRAVAAASGPGVSRETGQELARRELSKAIYHPATPLVERIINAIIRFLNAAGSVTPGGWWTLVALGALVVIIASAVLKWLGLKWPGLKWLGQVGPTRPRAAGLLVTGKPLRAADYRQDSEQLAAVADYSAAIIGRMRAIAAELSERAVLTQLPGRTADELAAETSRARPALTAELTAAARLFDEVRYGQRAGTLAGYQRLCDLDARIQTIRVPAARVPEPASTRAGAVS